jgi:hypothetical protein
MFAASQAVRQTVQLRPVNHGGIVQCGVIDIAAPPTRNRRRSIGLAVACVSLVVSLIACGVAGFRLNDADLLPVQSKPEVATAGQVEAVAHVRLPPGTVLLTAAYSHGLETWLSAKFRFPRRELDAFVAAGNFTAALTPGLRAVTAEHTVGGGDLWDPETAVSIAGIDEEQPIADGTRRLLLVNLDTPDTVTVYLYAGRG